MANGSNAPFLVTVGADYNLSIEQCKKDVKHILSRLPKDSRSIVVRANLNDISGLQHDLNKIAQKVQMSVGNVQITPNQSNIDSFRTSLENGLRTAGGVQINVAATQGSVLSLGASVERALVQAGGVDVPLVVGSQNVANLAATVSQALGQINPDDRTINVLADANAIEQEVRNVLQRVSQTPLDIHVNLIGLPQNNGNINQRLPTERRASRELYSSMRRFEVLNAREMDLKFSDIIPNDDIFRDIARFREDYENALSEFEQLNPVQYEVNGSATGQYILDPEELIDAAGRVRDAERSYGEAIQGVLKLQREQVKHQTDVTSAYRKQNQVLEQAFRLRDSLQDYDGAAATDITTRLNQEIDRFLQAPDSLDGLREFEQNVQRLRGEVLRLGPPVDDVQSRFSQMLRNRVGFAALAVAVSLVKRGIVQMYKEVVELDGAMVELRKVTDETDDTYNRFLEDAADRAKRLGASLRDVVSATSDFARLGYDLADAASLADAALVYKNVGDGITDINEATESVIATMQAFNIEAADAMTIVDKFNIIGNTEAISSGGVGDALMNSAAALHAANNSLEESIALVAAANTTAQDPLKVGTVMKTLSMYLRAAKTEAEEAGESTEGMASSVSELRAEILALTGNRVDIQIDENTFKSTYQILKELSEVWNTLTDVSQANILESISGKRNANITAALLSDFAIAERALATASNSDGSALAENEKVLESITGKLQLLTAAWQEFSAAVFDNDAIKFGIESLTAILNGLTSLDSVTKGFSSSVLSSVSVLGILLTTLHSFDVDITHLAESIVNLNNGARQARVTGAAAVGHLGLYAAAIAVVVTALSKLYQVWRKANPTFDELKTRVANAKQECADLKQEFDENTKRLGELVSLASSGEISIVEQEELNMLKEENTLLAQQLEIRKKIADLEEDELAKAALKEAKGYFTQQSMYGVADASMTKYSISNLSRLNQSLADDSITDQDELNKINSEIAAVKTRLVYRQQDLLNILSGLNVSIPEHREYYKAIQQEIDNITVALEGSGAVVKVWQRTWSDEQLYPGVTELKQKIIDLCTETEKANGVIGENSQIIDLLKTGVGAEIVADLDIQEDEFEQLIHYLYEVSNESLTAGTSISSFASQLADAEEALDGVADAFKTIAEGGELSVKQVEELLSDFPDLIDYLEVENGKLTISKTILQDKLNAYKENQIQALRTSKSTIEGLREEAEALKLNIDLEYQRFRQRRLADGDTQSEIDKAWSAAGVYENNIANIIAGYDSQIDRLNKQISLWENINLTTTLVGKIDPDKNKPDYDAKYKLLVDMKKEAEQNNERMKRMDGDWAKERIGLLEKVRDKAIEALNDAAGASAEEIEYLEDLLWELNDELAEIYENQIDAIQNIIDLTIEMVKENYEDQIDAIEKQTDAYNDLIEAKKKSLKEDKAALDYNRKVAEKSKEIAKLQSKIELLKLDNSREAAAERKKLEEEVAKLNVELADIQSDRTLEITEDTLDKSADAYEKANDDRVDALKELLKDEEALYKEAIEKIGNMEQSFYEQLEKWAKAHGEDIRKLADDWEVAKNAKQGYTDLDAAMSGISNNVSNLESTTQDGSYYSAAATAILNQMQKNSKWAKDNGTRYYTDPDGKTIDLHEQNDKLEDQFEALTGIQIEYDKTLGWINSETKKPLYKFHEGGVVGGNGSLRDNEVMSILEKNELVLENGRKMNLTSLFDNLRSTISSLVSANLFDNMSVMRGAVPAAAGNAMAPEINVTIQHNGDMSDNDAKRYGAMVGDEALKKLRNAFTKRGF